MKESQDVAWAVVGFVLADRSRMIDVGPRIGRTAGMRERL